MENYLHQQIEVCIRRINEYANQKGTLANTQWHYWCGVLCAYRQALAFIDMQETVLL